MGRWEEEKRKIMNIDQRISNYEVKNEEISTQHPALSTVVFFDHCRLAEGGNEGG